MSFCVVVSSSHLTKYASRGVVPWNAPWRNRSCMNAPTLSRICAHSGSSFGSNTTHLRAAVQALLDEQRRAGAPGRTSTRDASWSAPRSVRAPQTTRADDREGAQAVDAERVEQAVLDVGQRDRSAPATPLSAASRPAGAFQTPRVRVGARDDAGDRARTARTSSSCAVAQRVGLVDAREVERRVLAAS